MKTLFLILIFLLSFFLFISFFFSFHTFSSINSEIDSFPEKFEEDVTPSVSFLEELPNLGANPICLSPTRNCQSTNTEIVSLAKQLTSGKSKFEGARAIFNWCHSNIHYEEPMYFNTKYGALGTLHKKKGNCCDESHLLVALMRAAGFPTTYKNGDCYFKLSKRVIGHVWSEVEVDGKWYPLDISSSRNSFGVINSWSLRSLKRTVCELPF